MVEIGLFVIGTFFTIIGWYLKQINENLTMIRKDFEEHRLEDAKTYATKSEVEALKKDILERLHPVGEQLRHIEEFLRKDVKLGH